ncbi:MAG: hypothetical protein ABIC95_00665 [archaeon]
MKRFSASMVLIILAVLAVAQVAMAQPFGVTTENGTQKTGTGTTATSVAITGGNVTEVNITAAQITGRWAGFWGSITAGINLTDGVQTFYAWTVSNVTGAAVYAVNGSVTDWDLMQRANDTHMPVNLQGEATDNFNNTFNSSETFTVGTSRSIDNVKYAMTWQDGVQGTLLKSYALTTSDTNAEIFAAKAVGDADSFINGVEADFQLIVPAQSAYATPYEFYLELP